MFVLLLGCITEEIGDDNVISMVPHGAQNIADEKPIASGEFVVKNTCCERDIGLEIDVFGRKVDALKLGSVLAIPYFADPVRHRLVHRSLIVPVVPAEGVGVKVPLEKLGT